MLVDTELKPYYFFKLYIILLSILDLPKSPFLCSHLDETVAHVDLVGFILTAAMFTDVSNAHNLIY